MKVKIDNDTVIETDELSLEELSSIDDNLFAKIKEIEAEISIAKGNAKLTGEYRDPQWFHRANLALSLSKRNRDRLLRAIAQKRVERKNQKAVKAAIDEVRFERLFMQVVKDHLPPMVYRELIAKTQERFYSDGDERKISPPHIQEHQSVECHVHNREA